MDTIGNVTVTFINFATSALSGFLTTFLIVFIAGLIGFLSIELIFHYFDYKNKTKIAEKNAENKTSSQS